MAFSISRIQTIREGRLLFLPSVHLWYIWPWMLVSRIYLLLHKINLMSSNPNFSNSTRSRLSVSSDTYNSSLRSATYIRLSLLNLSMIYRCLSSFSIILHDFYIYFRKNTYICTEEQIYMEQMNEIMRFYAELRPTIDNIDGQALKAANSPSLCQTVFFE